MPVVTHWDRFSLVITGAGSTHSLGTCLPDRMYVAAMTAVRHWYTGYVDAIAVSFCFFHSSRKSCWSSAVTGGTGLPASWDAWTTATLEKPVSIQTPSILPKRWR